MLLPARGILAPECNQILQEEALGTTMKFGIKVQLSKGIVELGVSASLTGVL